MAVFLKNPVTGKLLTKNGKLLYRNVYYTLPYGETVVKLPNNADLLVTFGELSYGGDEVNYLGFSADFDLVVCTEEYQWGSYEIYGESLLSGPIYIYDHNGYENGDLCGRDNLQPNMVLKQYYTPVAILYFDVATKKLIVTENGL